jgi:elongator complex protein 3
MPTISDLITTIISYPDFDRKRIDRLKHLWAKNNKSSLLRNSDLLKAYIDLVHQKIIMPSQRLEKLLKIRNTRTISGVAPVAVLTKPYPCPGHCAYCPSSRNIPKSYLPDEPAVMRATTANFDPYLQVKRRIQQYLDIGHLPAKIELIVIGGSFSVLPLGYKFWFIRRCFEAANQQILKKHSHIHQSKQELQLLEKAQKVNETAKYRIVGLTLETRPDLINLKEIRLMRLLGCTRVELGVQTTDDKILKKCQRGHGVAATIAATKLLKNSGFKICYHMMPNLPGSSIQKDRLAMKEIYTNPDYKPDMVKIYPCVVIKNTLLYQWFKKGQYQSYPQDQLLELLTDIKQMTPRYVRINRLYRDIPAHNIQSGSKLSNMRQVLTEQMKKKGITCQCIRCREAKDIPIANRKLKLKSYTYPASDGKEVFMEYVDKDGRLFALLRIRFPNEPISPFKELNNSALIRELHTFGEALGIDSHQSKAIQHQGLGKKMLIRAESLAKKEGYSKIAVIAGVGTRDYYRKVGYKLSQTYMVKDL